MAQEATACFDTATESTFTLRQGVAFHDGTLLTAQDVVYSFQRIGDPELEAGQRPFISPIDLAALSAVDDHTVRFTLTQSSADFPMLAPVIIFIIADGSGATVATSGNGTGAFKLESLATLPILSVAPKPPWSRKPRLGL